MAQQLMTWVYRRVWQPYAPAVYRVLRAPYVLPLIVLLIAFAVRAHQLESQSLWNDEGNSLRLAERPVSGLIDAAGRDIHPPGYYLVLKAWIAAAGTNEFSLRALSLFVGVLAVAVTMALGRVLFGRGAYWVAGLLVAVSPFAVYYSQETRMYAQLGLLSAASMWAFVGWVRHLPHSPSVGFGNPSLQKPAQWQRVIRPALALAVINAAGLYTHYAFPFTMIAQGVIVAGLVAKQQHLSLPHAPTPSPASEVGELGPETGNVSIAKSALLLTFIALNLLTLALFAPWLPTAWDQVTSWPGTGVDIVPGEQLHTVLSWIIYGNTAGQVFALRFLWPALLVGAALWAWRDWRVSLLLAWAVIVIASLFVSGAYREANLKFLLPAQIAAALLMGAGAAALWQWDAPPAETPTAPREHRDRVFTRREWRAIARMLAVMCVFLVVIGQLEALDALYTDPAYARDDYRAIASRIESRARPGDAIILDAPNQAEVFRYYYDGDLPVYELPRGLGGDDAQTRADVQAVIAQHARIYVLFWGEEERDPNRVVQATLDAEAYPVGSRWYGDVRLALYAVPGPAPEQPQAVLDARFGEHISLTGYALSAESVQPGDVVGVTLFWTTSAPLDVRYKVTVQLLAPDGRLINQHDAEPGGNRALTTTWTPGESIRDTHGLIVPPDLAPGEYPVIVGLYDLNAPLDRLPVVVAGEPVGDALTLTQLTVR